MVAALALAACGGSDDSGLGAIGGPSAGVSTSSDPADWPVHVGEYPFSHSLRCYGVERLDSPSDGDRTFAPGCIHVDVNADRTTSVAGASLLGRGTVLNADDNVTLRYRGAAVHRADTDDAGNPERLGVVTFFDVTFPSTDFITEFTSGGLSDLTWRASTSPQARGTGTINQIGQAPRGLSDLFLTDEKVGGQTFTFVHMFLVSGPASFVVGDPTLSVAGWLDRDTSRGEGPFALVDQDPDDDVLTDVVDSIVRLAEALGVRPEQLGGGWFDERFGRMLADGETVTSYDRRGTSTHDGNDGQGGAGPDDVGSGAATIPPPPPPPTPVTVDTSVDIAALRQAGFDDGYTDGYASAVDGVDRYGESYDDPEPDVGEYFFGYEEGYETGLAEGPPAPTTTTASGTTAPPAPPTEGSPTEVAAAELVGQTSPHQEVLDAVAELFSVFDPDGGPVTSCLDPTADGSLHTVCYYLLDQQLYSLDEWAGGATDYLEVAKFTVMLNAEPDLGAVVVRLGSDDRGIDPDDPSYIGWVVTDVWQGGDNPPDWVPDWY
ncbi:MAG TPA: hypothetical protein VNQ73_17375 [Ilumatobacter sp.]|nr:hypothetical protein [Ilumatobacter sp.]